MIHFTTGDCENRRMGSPKLSRAYSGKKKVQQAITSVNYATKDSLFFHLKIYYQVSWTDEYSVSTLEY